MNYFVDDLVSTPRELIDYFLYNNRWFKSSNIFNAVSVGKGGMIFRGQSNANWPLVPKAFRPGHLKNYTPQPPSDEVDENHLRQHLGLQLHAEARAIHLFLANADSLGIPTPIDFTVTNHSIDLILAALNNKEDFDYATTFPPESLQRATALAQHHGVPTRFLDWSESPLIACYFAAYGASVFSQQLPEENQEIAIIFTHIDNFSKKDSPVNLIKSPRFENSHLLEQQGMFTSIKNSNIFFLENKRWPCLNDFSNSKFQIHRVRLPASEANNLLKLLFDLNITRHSLMPTLDNAATACSYALELFRETK